jgi:serine/threonine protein kinase
MRPGDWINGYFIQRRIGEGGMSVVYLARDSHGVEVAVKRLKDDYASDPEFVQRFEQEAAIMGTLQHPNVAQVINYVPHAHESVLVEEYLPGGSLADRIEEGRIPQKQALLWCHDALLGVDSAHQKGILHRDLKPGNLMFDAAGNIKVTDFGIAKVFGGPKLTRTRSEMGTPAYMSPEQISSPQEAYHLTDVYSMGVVLYELLTGRVPFEGKGDFDTKQAVLKEPPPSPRRHNPEISKNLERLVLKALKKNQAQRYGGCGEFAAQIDSYLRGEPFPFSLGDWIQEHPWLTVLLAIATLVILVLFSAVVRAS